MDQSGIPRLTYKVDLPGGQHRLRDAAMRVMRRCRDAEYFGLTKLNKILWKADFNAFAARRVPVTGRQYQRLPQGPVPVEMHPLLQELQRDGLVTIQRRPVAMYEEYRPIALANPSTRFFSADDLSYIDAAIEHYWSLTGSQASEDSHGIAWQTRADGDPMPYNLALLSDEKLTGRDIDRLTAIGARLGWRSQ